MCLFSSGDHSALQTVLSANLATLDAVSHSSFQAHELPTTETQGPWEARMAMLKTIVLFAGPALSIPLGDPLMSLVDTVCVGQFASTLELAALGPNTLIFQFSTYVVAALATACTW